MSSDSLAVITDRLIQRYGPEGVKALKTATFTREQLLSPTLDPDRYAYLMATRPEEVEGILNAPQIAADRDAIKSRDELSIFYTEIRTGNRPYSDLQTWLTQFRPDMERFLVDFPQVGSGAVASANGAILTEDLSSRIAFPVYEEWAASFQRCAVPSSGYPKLQLMCPDGVVRTGRELREAIKQWPMELLEPKPKQLTREQAQSADEFLREHPELHDDRPPALLKDRFNREFQRFLASDVGRAWRKRMQEYGFIEESSSRMYQYMNQHRVEFTQKGFEFAALAVSDEISIALYADDIGGARTKGLEIHDAGGGREHQLPLGSTGGMAGQSVPSVYNPDKVWTDAEVRRELRRITADELKERLADKAFVAALDEFKLR